MKLNNLSLSFTSAEVSMALKSALAKAGSQVPPELSDLDIQIKQGQIQLSTKKKVGFMPVTFSAAIELRPAPEADGIVVTLAKISAGFIGSQAIAAQILGQVGRSLQGVPGCSVSGNDITLTKQALAARAPWLDVAGSIRKFNVVDDRVEIEIG